MSWCADRHADIFNAIKIIFYHATDCTISSRMLFLFRMFRWKSDEKGFEYWRHTKKYWRNLNIFKYVYSLLMHTEIIVIMLWDECGKPRAAPLLHGCYHYHYYYSTHRKMRRRSKGRGKTIIKYKVYSIECLYVDVAFKHVIQAVRWKAREKKVTTETKICIYHESMSEIVSMFVRAIISKSVWSSEVM